MNPATYPAATQLSSCMASLKGEPKALGTVQIMIGITTFMFGIVLTLVALTPGTISGITLWGSLIFIISGSLSVAAGNHHNPCVVKASLVMNVISALVAGLALLLLFVDMLMEPHVSYCPDYYRNRYDYYGGRCHYAILLMWYGIYGMLFILALLELIVSICTSVFACKVTGNATTRVTFSQPLIHTQAVVYTQQMNPPPMYNSAYYNQQVPQPPSATVISYNIV